MNGWTRQKAESYNPNGQCTEFVKDDAMWTFEPSVALRILEDWEKREGLRIVRRARLDRSPKGVVVKDGRIVCPVL